MSQTLYAYHYNSYLKKQIVNRISRYQKDNKIVQLHHWQNDKGCIIGCVVHSHIHEDFEKIGIPTWFAYGIDVIFDDLSYENARLFPYRIMHSIPIGFSNWGKLYNDIGEFMNIILSEPAMNYINTQALKTEPTQEQMDHAFDQAAYNAPQKTHMKIANKIIELLEKKQ